MMDPALKQYMRRKLGLEPDAGDEETSMPADVSMDGVELDDSNGVRPDETASRRPMQLTPAARPLQGDVAQAETDANTRTPPAPVQTSGREGQRDSVLDWLKGRKTGGDWGSDIDHKADLATVRSKRYPNAADNMVAAEAIRALGAGKEQAANQQRDDVLGYLYKKQGREDKAAELELDKQKLGLDREKMNAGLEEKRLETGKKDADKKAALVDRKKLMLQLYPEHKGEIESVTDLGDAQTLQTALEGRAGREQTQHHSDAAATEASKRELEKQIAFEKWKSTHRPPTAEQAGQLEGIEKSDAAVDTFEKGLGSTSTLAGKAGAAAPKLGGAMGLPGADFQSLREGTAIALARGLEGGMARPGNVEIIMKMLPEASDSEAVKAQKMAHVREFIANNREAFRKAAEQAGTEVHQSKGATVSSPPVMMSNGKETRAVPPEHVKDAEAEGYKRVKQ